MNGKKELKIEALRRIDYLLEKKIVHEEEIYYLVKNFFKRYLNLEYEFTYEELLNELTKIFIEEEVREVLEEFLEEVSFIEFSDEHFSTEELKELIKVFALIIDNLIPEEIKGPEGEILERIKKEKESLKIKKEERIKEEKSNQYKKNQKGVLLMDGVEGGIENNVKEKEKLKMLEIEARNLEEESENIKTARKFVNESITFYSSGNYKKAVEYYLKALSIYENKLTIQEKKRIYKELKELYELLKGENNEKSNKIRKE